MSQELYSQADRFCKLVDSEDSGSELKSFAGRENRKSIEKKLREAKINWDSARLVLQDKRRQYEALAKEIAVETEKMKSAQSFLSRGYDILHSMDLISAESVKIPSSGDDVGYIKKNRIYRLNINKETGEVELEPFKRKQLPVDDEDVELADPDENESEDEMSADDLIEALNR